MLDGLIMLKEYSVNVRVDWQEIALEVGNESRDGILWNSEYAPNNIPDPVLLSQAKVTSDDPTRIRKQQDW
jgi:hypothetical protein